MSFTRYARPLAVALSVGALNAAFLTRSARPTTRIAEVAIVAAYLEVAASHWRGLTLGTDDRPGPDSDAT